MAVGVLPCGWDFPSRRAWLRQISSAEYAELLALSRHEAIGLERADLWAAAASQGSCSASQFAFEPTQPTLEEMTAEFAPYIVDGNGQVESDRSEPQRGSEPQIGGAQIPYSQSVDPEGLS